MEMNNFKALQAKQMALFEKEKQKAVFERLNGTMDVFRFVGAIVEMYVPVMANTVIGLTSADGGLGQDLFPEEEIPLDDGDNIPDKPRGPQGSEGSTR